MVEERCDGISRRDTNLRETSEKALLYPAPHHPLRAVGVEAVTSYAGKADSGAHLPLQLNPRALRTPLFSPRHGRRADRCVWAQQDVVAFFLCLPAGSPSQLSCYV